MARLLTIGSSAIGVALCLFAAACGSTSTNSESAALSEKAENGDAGTSQGVSKEQAVPRIALVLRNISDPGALAGRGEGPVDIAFSPGVWISHSEQILLNQEAPEEEVIEELAEMGKTRAFRERMGALGANVSGLIGPEVDGDYAGGMVEPGKGVSAAFDVAPDDLLMFAAMFTQSNDTLIGFDADGVSLSRLWQAPDGIVDVSDELRWWNAGTEVNEPAGEGESQADCLPELCDGEAEGGRLEAFETLSPEGEAYPAPSSVAQVWLVDCALAADAGPRCFPAEADE